MERAEILADISDERDYQDSRWGVEFDNKNTANDWASYINRYASKACEFKVSPEEFKRTMTKIAALAVAAIETVERNGDILPLRHYDSEKQ